MLGPGIESNLFSPVIVPPKRTGKITQWRKCLLHKYEGQSLDPQHQDKMMGVVVYL